MPLDCAEALTGFGKAKQVSDILAAWNFAEKSSELYASETQNERPVFSERALTGLEGKSGKSKAAGVSLLMIPDNVFGRETNGLKRLVTSGVLR